MNGICAAFRVSVIPPMGDDSDGGERHGDCHRGSPDGSRRTVTRDKHRGRRNMHCLAIPSGVSILDDDDARDGDGCENCAATSNINNNGRRRRTANKKYHPIACSHMRTRRERNTMIVFFCACTILLSSNRYLILVEGSSSNSGSSSGRGSPFLVMSEITVQPTDTNHDVAPENSIQGSPVPVDVQSGGVNSDTGGSTSPNDESRHASSEIGANERANSGEQTTMNSGGGSSGSDTDGEDEDKLGNGSSDEDDGGFGVQNSGEPVPAATSPASDASAAASQPLRTLKRLQAMLDDSDYATHTVASGAAVVDGGADIEGRIVAENDAQTSPVSRASSDPGPGSANPGAPPPSSPAEKLWTSKDRAKYRRTRRTEKQRQHHQQREYDESRARKMRDIQRQRIIREERERKELEDLRRKQGEVAERQRYEQQRRRELQQRQFLRSDEFTDDDTDTDGSGGFDLPNLPVYLSDAEATDDFSEETEEAQPRLQQPLPRLAQARPSLNYSPPDPLQEYSMPNQNVGGQNSNMANRPFQYNYPEAVPQNQQQQQQQSPPPQANNGPYLNYQQQYPRHFPEHQQQANMPQQFQYNPNNAQQMQQENHQRQYEQQYATWAQAAANGYYYPPPQPPSAASFQHPQQQHQDHPSRQHVQGQSQQTPPRASYLPHPYGTPQQQQNQGSAYALQPQHQSYLAQHQRESSARAAYSNVPPGQVSFSPPRSQARAPAVQRGSVEQQRGFFGRESEGGNDRGATEIERQLGDGSGTTLSGYTNDEATTASTAIKPRTLVDPMTVKEDPQTNATTAVSSTNGQMTVNSAFASPATPLIPPTMSLSSKVPVTPIDAEELIDESAVLIAGAESCMSFDSVQKLSFSALSVALLSYCAVSPRSLPFPEYNRLFLQNLGIVSLAAIAPVLLLLAVYDGKYNNINTAIGTFHVSFTLGYALAFISEIIVTTVVRLGVFKIWEPAIFSLTPEVPSIILPWVLREKQYKPKRITLFAADFAASCVASPIIEEYLKLKVLQWTCKLPRNFKQSINVQKSKRRKKLSYVVQPVRSLDAPQVVNINCYVSQMLVASFGLKLFDVFRRILMYTKETDEYKRIYAVCRGTFPIHELCGMTTALLLAKRDVLGVNLPQWKIIGPAVFLHAMANFRGMKPIFKYNSSTPWSEMQINQLRKEDNDYIWKQLLPKTYSKLVWLTILCRVFGFCIKNYYLIGRQAMKRTTTYSGKLHAFNAKLQTDSILKRG